MNDFEIFLATGEQPGWVAALAWALFHSLWIGTFAALLLKGGLELQARQRPVRRYGLALAALFAVPLGFAATLARELGPRTLVPRFANDAAPAFPPINGPTHDASALDLLRVQAAELLEPAAPWLVGAWAVGLVLLVTRVLLGWAWCRRFAARAHPAEPLLQVRVARLGRRLGLRRRARLYLSRTLDVPMVVTSGVGSLPAAVVMPYRTLHELGDEDLDSVLAHELAHVRRLDGPLHLVQALVEALFFFHPAVRWIGACVRAEREHCCDELALSACAGPRVLARALAQLEVQRPRRLRPAPAVALGASDGCLLGRVERLLGRARPARRALGSTLAVAGLAGLACGAFLRPVAPLKLEIFAAKEAQLLALPPGQTVRGARMLVLRHDDVSEAPNRARRVGQAVQVRLVTRGEHEVALRSTDELPPDTLRFVSGTRLGGEWTEDFVIERRVPQAADQVPGAR